MLKLTAILPLLVIACGNPSGNNKGKQEATSEVLTVTAYNNATLSYKDSIDHQIHTFKNTHIDLDAPGEGGEAILYLSGKDTLKMDITFYGEMGKRVYALYLKNSHPVFYIDSNIYYREPIYLSKEVKIASATIDEIILRNNTIVSWSQNGKAVNDKREEKAQEIRDLYKEIQTLIRE